MLSSSIGKRGARGLSDDSAGSPWADALPENRHDTPHIAWPQSSELPDNVTSHVQHFFIGHLRRKVVLKYRDLRRFGVDQVLSPSTCELFDRITALFDLTLNDGDDLIVRQRVAAFNLDVVNLGTEKPNDVAARCI